MLSGPRHPKYVVVPLGPLRSRDAGANLPGPSQLRFPSLRPGIPVMSLYPTEPTEKRWPALHSQARCCGTLLPNGEGVHRQMSDVQARHEPLSEPHTYVSSYLAGQGRAEAGNSKKKASNTKFGHRRSHEESCMRIIRSTHTT